MKTKKRTENSSALSEAEYDQPAERQSPPFCCEGAPAFRRGEESQLSFSILNVMWYY